MKTTLTKDEFAELVSSASDHMFKEYGLAIMSVVCLHFVVFFLDYVKGMSYEGSKAIENTKLFLKEVEIDNLELAYQAYIENMESKK